MELLTNLYDNFLIYYPNVFFPTISVTGILVLVLIVKFILPLGKKARIIFFKINNDIGKIKIRRAKFQKINNVKFSPTKTMTNLFKFVYQIIVIALSSVNIFFKYLEKRILKLVRRVGKEILID